MKTLSRRSMSVTCATRSLLRTRFVLARVYLVWRAATRLSNLRLNRRRISEPMPVRQGRGIPKDPPIKAIVNTILKEETQRVTVVEPHNNMPVDQKLRYNK